MYQIIRTADGSMTLETSRFNVTYHSNHGALQESRHVFIKALLDAISFPEHIKVLEIGFGTGLNVLLSLEWAMDCNRSIEMTTIEKYPITTSLALQLDYPLAIGRPELTDHFELIHSSPWGSSNAIDSHLALFKIEVDFEDLDMESQFHGIMLDAFAPSSQPQFWSTPFLLKLYRSMLPGGILTTFCAQGAFKRSLIESGFEIEALPGPPGKREMTRARRPI